MRTQKKPIDLLFPAARASLLRLFFSYPPRQFHVRDIARRAGLAVSAVHEELHNLTSLGLLASSSNGYHRFYGANSTHILFEPLSRMVAASEKTPVRGRPYRSVRRQKKQVKPRPLPPDRPMNWGIFKRD